MEVDMAGVWLQVPRAGENCHKPGKQQKYRSKIELGVAGYYTMTLKPELGYLKLESL